MGTNVGREIGKELARFRVSDPGVMKYFAKEMTPDQISERRIWLRKILFNYPQWANMSSNDLDCIRLIRINKGYLIEDKDGYSFLLSDKKITDHEFGFRRVRAMMPFDFMNVTGKDFNWHIYHMDTLKSKELINKYIMNFEAFKQEGMGLYIYSGTKGSGKTMLACCLLNEICKRYAGSVKFANILDFLEMTKKGFDGKDMDIYTIYNASLLVIDDIGVQLSKEWIDTVLYRLINNRYVNRLPTIYTSNMHIDKLKMDDRILDRMESTTYPIALPEENIRRYIRKQEKDKLLDQIKQPH